MIWAIRPCPLHLRWHQNSKNPFHLCISTPQAARLGLSCSAVAWGNCRARADCCSPRLTPQQRLLSLPSHIRSAFRCCTHLGCSHRSCQRCLLCISVTVEMCTSMCSIGQCVFCMCGVLVATGHFLQCNTHESSEYRVQGWPILGMHVWVLSCIYCAYMWCRVHA